MQSTEPSAETFTLEDFEGFHGQAPQLYLWESLTFPERHSQTLTLPECQSLVNQVWINQLGLKLDCPLVNDGRGSCNARTYESRIFLPRWARNPVIVIHELSHCITDLFDEHDSDEHGGKFVKVLLTLLAVNLPYKYPELRKSAIQSDLKVSRIDMMNKLKGFQ